MANPYSTPSEYTPRSFNFLEQFGELAAKKEAEYKASQDTMGKLMADLPTQEGFLTPGLIKEVNSDYTKKILDVQDQLLKNKDVSEATRNLARIAAEYKQDNRVLSGARDAERSKTMPLWELENQGSYTGYKNPDGSPIAVDFKTLTPSQIDQHYANVAKAPDWKEEDTMWLHMTPEEKTRLSGLKMLPPTETGEIFFWDGKQKTSIRNLAESGNFPTLKKVAEDLYDTNSTTASNFYSKSKKGKDSYLKDFFERGQLFNINNMDQDQTIRASALNNGDGSGSGKDKKEIGAEPIQMVNNPGGYIGGEALLSPDRVVEDRNAIPKLDAEIEQLRAVGKTQEADLLEQKRSAMESNVAAYDVAEYEWENSDGAAKLTERFYKENNTNAQEFEYIDKGQEFIAQHWPQGNVNPQSIPVITDQLISDYLKSTGYSGNLLKGVEDFKTTSGKATAFDKIKKAEVDKYIKTDVVNEIQTFAPINATDEYRDQLNATLMAGAGSLDWVGAELINSSNGKYGKIDFRSDETKAKALASLVAQGFTQEEMKTMKLETQGDGAYFSINLNRHVANAESSIGGGSNNSDVEDDAIDDEFQMVTNKPGEESGRSILRMKINKDELYKDLTERGNVKSSNYKMLQLMEETTTLTNSGSGGFTHGTELGGVAQATILQIFTPEFNNSKRNYKDDLDKLNTLYKGELDNQFMANPVIKGKQIKYDNGGQVKNGLRLETGRTPETTKAFDTGDYMSEMGNQVLSTGNESDKILLAEYVNSITMSDLKSTGYNSGGGFNIPAGNPVKDTQAIWNLAGAYIDAHPGLTLMELNQELGKYVTGLDDAPYTFADKSSFGRYLARGSGKKQTSQSVANPLGVK